MNAFNWQEMSLKNRADYGLVDSTKYNSGAHVTKTVERKRKETPGYGTVHGISTKVLRLAPKAFAVYSKARVARDKDA